MNTKEIVNKIIARFKKDGKDIYAIFEYVDGLLYIVTVKEDDMFNNRYVYNIADDSIVKQNISIYDIPYDKEIYSWMD